MDSNGWYKEISDEEFSTLMNSKKIILKDGIYVYSDDDYVSGDGIYSNPGATLKGIATAIFVIGMIVSIITAVFVGKLGYEFNFALFALIAIVGTLVSYLSGLSLAALGDLVTNVNAIKKHITK